MTIGNVIDAYLQVMEERWKKKFKFDFMARKKASNVVRLCLREYEAEILIKMIRHFVLVAVHEDRCTLPEFYRRRQKFTRKSF